MHTRRKGSVGVLREEMHSKFGVSVFEGFQEWGKGQRGACWERLDWVSRCLSLLQHHVSSPALQLILPNEPNTGIHSSRSSPDSGCPQAVGTYQVGLLALPQDRLSGYCLITESMLGIFLLQHSAL